MWVDLFLVDGRKRSLPHVSLFTFIVVQGTEGVQSGSVQRTTLQAIIQALRPERGQQGGCCSLISLGVWHATSSSSSSSSSASSSASSSSSRASCHIRTAMLCSSSSIKLSAKSGALKPTFHETTAPSLPTNVDAPSVAVDPWYTCLSDELPNSLHKKLTRAQASECAPSRCAGSRSSQGHLLMMRLSHEP